MSNKHSFNVKLIFPCRLDPYDPYSRCRNYIVPYENCPGYVLPYGLGILADFLKKHGYDVELEDLSVKHKRYVDKFLANNISRGMDVDILESENEIDAFLNKGEARSELSGLVDTLLDSVSWERFSLAGFSIFSRGYLLFSLMLAKKIKQRFNIPIVFGGAFINICGNMYSGSFNFIDYMITGDGSVPLFKLIQHLEGKIGIDEVPNLSYRDNGRIHTNHFEVYPIDDMPVPDFSGLPLNLYDAVYNIRRSGAMLPYQITRGCANKCSFCNFRYANDRLEFKSYEKVVNELCQMKEDYKCNYFYFCDDALNNSYEYLEGLCDIFIKHNLGISWNVYVKAGNLDRHILTKMKKAGCHYLIFGIESGSDRILEMMNKGVASEQASQVLRWASETGIKNAVSFIAGYPHEKQEDINQTLEFIGKNKKYINMVYVFLFTLVYNCGIYLDQKKHGLANLLPTSPSSFSFKFDESGGLKWEEKQRQQRDCRKQIARKIKMLFFAHNLSIFLKVLLKSAVIKIRGSRD